MISRSSFEDNKLMNYGYTATTYKIIKFDTNKILYILNGMDIQDIKKRLNTECSIINSNNNNYYELVKQNMKKNNCIIINNDKMSNNEIDLLIKLSDSEKYNIIIKSVVKMN